MVEPARRNGLTSQECHIACLRGPSWKNTCWMIILFSRWSRLAALSLVGE